MKRYSFYAAWLIAAIATLISLYYSEILDLDPCKLCSYQRIFLFPLPILLFPLIFKQKREFIPYILPLPIIGFFIALYQTIVRPSCCFSDPNQHPNLNPYPDNNIDLNSITCTLTRILTHTLTVTLGLALILITRLSFTLALI